MEDEAELDTRLWAAPFLKNEEGEVSKFESLANMERMPVQAWKKAGDVFFSSCGLVNAGCCFDF